MLLENECDKTILQTFIVIIIKTIPQQIGESYTQIISDFQIALNNTLKDFKNDLNIVTCESSLTTLIWNQINERIHEKSPLTFDHNRIEDYIKQHVNIEIEDTNLNTLNKSSLKVYLPDRSDNDDNSHEKFRLFEDRNLANKLNSLNHDDTKRSSKHIKNDINYLERPPFLVAIFETFEYLTAQTCSGTLLSSHWVLTLPSCIELLSHMQNNV